MLKAHILRSGSVKVKLEIEVTLDELKSIKDHLRAGGGLPFTNDAVGGLLTEIAMVSKKIEGIFEGAVNDEQQ